MQNKELAHSYYMLMDNNNAYKECLEAYDLAKALYGSEINEDGVDILVIMASIKVGLLQLEEAKNIFTKGKEIEVQLSSKFSQRYKNIHNLEENLLKSKIKTSKSKRIKAK